MNRWPFVATLLSALTVKCVDAHHLLGQQQQANTASPSDKDSPEQIEQWMDTWRTRGYEGPLILSRFADPIYLLYSPIKWLPPQGSHEPAMAAFTVPKGFVTDLASIPRATIYEAVRIGGQKAWDDNRALKNRGERRILMQFPDDPTISWDTWKQDKRHFAGPA